MNNPDFEEITESVDWVFDVGNGYLAPAQVKSEIASLLGFLKNNKPKVIMEIGTARGGTLFLFSKVAPKDSLIISLDLPGGPFGGGYPRWKMPLYKSFSEDKQRIILVRENSHQTKTLQRIKEILGNKELDFLFIDGDHTYDGVKRDFALYKQLVKRGGTIAFHDIVPHPPEARCGVNIFWDEIKDRYESQEFVEDWNQGWSGIGLIKV
jgi:predicted O-methyltransferase YrrM